MIIILKKQLLFYIVQLFSNDAYLLVLKYLHGNSYLTMEKVSINVLENKLEIM
jgi:hypothetical protein